MDQNFVGQIRVDKTKLEQIITLPNFIFGQLHVNWGQYMTSYRLDE